MTFEEILSQAKELPLSQRKALIHDLVESIAEEGIVMTPKKRIAGLHAGQGTISDDFNEELPDSFWLGQDE